jgi:hypothetical protein
MDAQTVNETWQFEIGAMITHRDQPMLSLVMTRQKTTKGREVYGIRRLREACEV